MTIDSTSLNAVRGATVKNRDGDKLGKVDEVYLDNETSAPEWAAVKTGLFGGNVSLVPLSESSFDGSTLTVPFTKATIQGAPHHDPGREITADDEDELYAYYGVGGTTTATTGYTDTATTTGTVGRGTVGRDTSGPETDDAMTRSEEHLRVGTQRREAGRARLRKYIVSHTETQTVPVSHEEIVVEREAITDANRGAAMSGGDLTEEEHEVVLHEERAVVAKETVPVERVRLDTRTVTGQETVSAEVREERIETDVDPDVKTVR